jgi:cytochrome c551/c552
MHVASFNRCTKIQRWISASVGYFKALGLAATGLLLIWTSGCKTGYRHSEADVKVLGMLQRQCLSCHHPYLEMPNQVAPPLSQIRKLYLDRLGSRDQFINGMSAFMSNPASGTSLMPDVVKKYGLMPKTSLAEEDLQQIAGYLYDFDSGLPAWQEAWATYKNQSGIRDLNVSYATMVLNIAGEAKAVLGKNLLSAIQQKDAAFAVEFCNTRAYPLTDSVAALYQASIKRVSDKPRNHMNRANETELAYILELKEKLAKGEKISPKITERNGIVTGYHMIETVPMCLQCHGIPGKNILPETQNKIKSLYPYDEATGYSENQVRGIWVIEVR